MKGDEIQRAIECIRDLMPLYPAIESMVPASELLITLEQAENAVMEACRALNPNTLQVTSNKLHKAIIGQFVSGILVGFRMCQMNPGLFNSVNNSEKERVKETKETIH